MKFFLSVAVGVALFFLGVVYSLLYLNGTTPIPTDPKAEERARRRAAYEAAAPKETKIIRCEGRFPPGQMVKAKVDGRIGMVIYEPSFTGEYGVRFASTDTPRKIIWMKEFELELAR